MDENQGSDWKRRCQRETKVNKELGRRLREMKRQLAEERGRTQTLSAQVLYLTKHLNSNDRIQDPRPPCLKCERLEAKVARLETMVDQPVKLSRLDTFTTAPLHYEDSTRDDKQASAESAPFDTNKDVPLANDACNASSPRTLSYAGKDTQRINELASNQMDETCYVLTDGENASVGALFKYAVVLAGPAQNRSKSKPRVSFTDRFKPLDLSRLRTPQDWVEQSDDHESSSESNGGQSGPGGKGKAPSPKSGSLWPLKRQSHAVPDNVNETRVSSPIRRAATGFFSTFVPNGRRSGALLSAPSTPPLPPLVDPIKATTVPRPSIVPASKLLCVYPPHAGKVQELEGLLEICFPYGDDPPAPSEYSLPQLKHSLQERHRTYRSLDSTFVLTIASASTPTEVTYAICVRCPLFPENDDEGTERLNPADLETETLSDGPTQCCLCLLSPYPFFGLFFKVLYGIAVLWNTKRRDAVMAKNETREVDQMAHMLEKPLGMLDFVEVFQGVMERLKTMALPSMGGWSRMVLSPKVTPLAFHRPHSASLGVERRHLVLEYAAPLLFGLLSVDQVLFLLGCLCSERKVLVVSDHVNIVSSCVLALITLLHPLQWAGPVIPVLPPRLDELLEAPVPLIAGRVSINSASIENFSTFDHPLQDVIEMNMDQNALHMHDEDLVTYHELKLPECDELVHELHPYSTLLFGKHAAPDFPTVQQDEACKIMCTRIHHHIESICALAMAKKDASRSTRVAPLDHDSDQASSDPSSPSRESITRLGAERRCSAMVADYLTRFQATQMFSMLTLQGHDADRESDDSELELDDSENDGVGDEEYHYSGKESG